MYAKSLFVASLTLASTAQLAASVNTVDMSRGAKAMDNPYFNPSALLDQHYRSQVGLELGMAVDARSGLVTKGEALLQGAFDDFQSFDQAAVESNAGRLITSFDDVKDAADAFNGQGDQTYSALATANAQAVASTQALQGSIQELRALVDGSQRDMLELNERPVSGYLLANGALVNSGEQLPLLVSFDQRMQVGSALRFNDQDTEFFSNLLDDAADYLKKLEGLQTTMQGLLDAAKAWQDAPLDPALQEEYQQQQTAYQTALTEFTGYKTANGTLTMTDGQLALAADFDPDQLQSSFVVDASLMSQVTLGSAWQQTVMNQPLQLGANLHLRRVQLHRVSYRFADLQQLTQQEWQQQLQASRTRYLINVDLAAAYRYGLPQGSVLASLVVQDVLPYRSGRALPEGLELAFQPQATLGLAYQSRVVNAHASVDLNPSQPMLASYGQRQQLLSLGVETRWGKSLAYRLGYQRNLRQQDDQSWHTGIGLTPWGYGVDLGLFLRPVSLSKDRPYLNDWHLGVATRLSATF